MGTKSKWLKGKLTFHNGPAVDANVFTSTTVGGVANKIPSYGMVVIDAPASPYGYYIDGAPAIGQKLDIVSITSEVAFIFAATSGHVVSFTGSVVPGTCEWNGIVSVPGGAVGGNLVPCGISLRGLSTSKWGVTSCTTKKGGFYFTTAVTT
jgi:hypothetical protein